MKRTAPPRPAARALTVCALGLLPVAAFAQPTTMRSDAVWAPTTAAVITLDGALDEAPWADAPALEITYGVRAGDPGSGYSNEAGLETPVDPTQATVRFLVSDGQLYMGAEVQDNSVGGSREFNRKDGFLMSIMNAILPTVGDFGAAGFNEYFYSWWYATLPEGEPIPDIPGFIGTYGNFDDPLDRTPEQIEKWDAVTIVEGVPNDDSNGADGGYTVEMRFDLSDLGYDLTEPTQVAFSISVYDVDGFFPFNDAAFSATRVWWQNAFNGPVQNYGRIFVDPAVMAGDPLPEMPYDWVIPNGAGLDVTVDGSLDEDVWSRIEGFEIAVATGEGDEDALAVRAGYPGIGPYASGQFQPTLDLDGDGVADPIAPILDAGRARVKWFHKDGRLYVGVDVMDQAVTGGEADENRRDGFRLGVNDRSLLEPNDNYLFPRPLALRLDADGNPIAEEALAAILAENPDAAEVAVTLGPNTIINDASTADDGYQIELAIDLDVLGYDGDLAGDVLFVGATLFDWDAFDDPLSNYGTRAWAFRERANASAAYALLSPDLITANEGGPDAATGFVLLGAAPNPTRGAATLRYVLPEAGRAAVEVFDVLGRRVAAVDAGAQAAGLNAADVSLGLPAGLYLYRITLDGASGALVSPSGRFTVVR